MIYNIYITIIIISLTTIVIVLFRKFPIVANLDLEQLPEEQEIQKKKEIIKKRLNEKGDLVKKEFKEKITPINRLWRLLQLKFRIYVGKIERLLHYEDLLKSRQQEINKNPVEKERELNDLIIKAESLVKEENYDKAEEIYISAIKLDKKSIVAYRGLADIYLAKGAFDEAFQTYDFLTKLTPEDDSLMVKLSELYEEKNKIDEAIHYMEKANSINDSIASRFFRLAELYLKESQTELALEATIQALELEPKNPKYLDFLIETAIICDNKDLALKSYEDLRLVNPENQKLEELKEKIDKLQ